LHRWMELETLYAKFNCLALRLLNSCCTGSRVNGPERDKHVVIACRPSYEIFDRVWHVAIELGARVQGKDHRCHPKIAVYPGDLVDGWRAVFGFEVFGRCFVELFRHGLMTLLVQFYMNVDINRRDGRDVNI